ncbi:MAG: hypothetical protein RR444_11855 [Oscillospiraceae bacterium]
MKENIKIKVYLNEWENQKIKDIAQQSGLTQSEVLRRIALEKPICIEPKQEFFDMLNELYGIHNSFKMLLKFDETLEMELVNIEKFILALQQKYQLGGDDFGNNKPVAN